eukprot:9915196-Karenia_brevis.AAC.1
MENVCVEEGANDADDGMLCHKVCVRNVSKLDSLDRKGRSRDRSFEGGWDLSIFEDVVLQPGQLGTLGLKAQKTVSQLPGRLGEMFRVLVAKKYEKYASPTGRLTQRDLLPMPFYPLEKLDNNRSGAEHVDTVEISLVNDWLLNLVGALNYCYGLGGTVTNFCTLFGPATFVQTQALNNLGLEVAVFLLQCA